METVFWSIGIVAALVCGWIYAGNRNRTFTKLVNVGTFITSVAMIDVAIAMKNPEISGWFGTIAVLVAVIVGAVWMAGAGFFIRVGYEAPDKRFYVIAAILLLVGEVITNPGMVHAAYKVVTAGSY